MTFADDLAALPRGAQIALVRAVAREHGDELDEVQASEALDLYTALSAVPEEDADGPEARRARQIKAGA